MTSAERYRTEQAAARRRGEVRSDRGYRRLGRAVEASSRRNSDSRAWINGREVGGEDPRYLQLRRSYD